MGLRSQCQAVVSDARDGLRILLMAVDKCEPCISTHCVACRCHLRHEVIAQDCVDTRCRGVSYISAFLSMLSFELLQVQAVACSARLVIFTTLVNHKLAADTDQGHVSDRNIAELLPAYWRLAIRP